MEFFYENIKKSYKIVTFYLDFCRKPVYNTDRRGVHNLRPYLNQNICKFLPKFDNYNFFNIINLVYETKCKSGTDKRTQATYCIYLVTQGEGVFYNDRGSETLRRGDILVMPPAKMFAIDNVNRLKYIYISYLGVRANILADDYKIDTCGAVYHGYERLIPMWQSAFDTQREITNLFCESIVLYTFAEIGRELFVANTPKSPDSAAERIKDLIDERFTESDLNLESIADALCYHPKYVSSVFSKQFNVRIGDYIRTLRIQHACTLMEQGLTSLKNISVLCGYEDSLYFSSVFKKQMGVSPKEHIQKVAREHRGGNT